MISSFALYKSKYRIICVSCRNLSVHRSANKVVNHLASDAMALANRTVLEGDLLTLVKLSLTADLDH